VYGHSRAVRTVVIDPGHGGKDPGAVGRRNMEKDIVLSISVKLGELINQYMPDVNVVFTRETDVFVGLNERANIANRNNADLFISIHCNGSGNRAAYGSETFVMGYDKSESNLAVAMKENASIFFEENYQDIYEGFNPNKPETHIIFSLFQHQYINQSLKFASLVQDQFRERAHRVDRGVKQGPFWVLHRTAMPAVLVEVGFLTNEEEEVFMASNGGQNILASAIFRAFRDYKNAQEQLLANSIPREPLVVQQQPAPTPAVTQAPSSKVPTAPQSQEQRPRNVAEGINAPAPENKQAENNESLASNEATSALPVGNATEVVSAVVFKVQFLSSERILPLNSPLFKGLRNVEHYHHMGLFRYTVGNEPTLTAAHKLQASVRGQGFRDAFVVAFINGERATIQAAQKLLGQ